MSFKRITAVILVIIFVFLFTSCDNKTLRDSVQSALRPSHAETDHLEETNTPIDENGIYDSRGDVSLYIKTYGHLPKNYITKKQAEALGWEGGSLRDYAPGKCIGGDRFGNYEELLPQKKNRVYKECDVDTLGKDSRGAKRIIYSNDGLIYFTADHYKSFTLLYGDENK